MSIFPQLREYHGIYPPITGNDACHYCGGDGKQLYKHSFVHGSTYIKCSACNGTGWKDEAIKTEKRFKVLRRPKVSNA